MARVLVGAGVCSSLLTLLYVYTCFHVDIGLYAYTAPLIQPPVYTCMYNDSNMYTSTPTHLSIIYYDIIELNMTSGPIAWPLIALVIYDCRFHCLPVHLDKLYTAH